jgi:hypothetical protein
MIEGRAREEPRAFAKALDASLMLVQPSGPGPLPGRTSLGAESSSGNGRDRETGGDEETGTNVVGNDNRS